MNNLWLSSRIDNSSHLAYAGVMESVSDSGYEHDDISCMTYDIHVDILLRCVFVV